MRAPTLAPHGLNVKTSSSLGCVTKGASLLSQMKGCQSLRTIYVEASSVPASLADLESQRDTLLRRLPVASHMPAAIKVFFSNYFGPETAAFRHISKSQGPLTAVCLSLRGNMAAPKDSMRKSGFHSSAATSSFLQ